MGPGNAMQKSLRSEKCFEEQKGMYLVSKRGMDISGTCKGMEECESVIPPCLCTCLKCCLGRQAPELLFSAISLQTYAVCHR